MYLRCCLKITIVEQDELLSSFLELVVRVSVCYNEVVDTVLDVDGFDEMCTALVLQIHQVYLVRLFEQIQTNFVRLNLP